jgi:methyl-accepting chemotaxis protein
VSVAKTSTNGYVANVRAAAAACLKLGRVPVPNGHKTKEPVPAEWQYITTAGYDLDAMFPPNRSRNIGVSLGKPSGGLVDADLDCDEAMVAAAALALPTKMLWGRQSAPTSHRGYVVADPPAKASDAYLDPLRKGKGAKLLELRSTGGQTVIPPSILPGDDKGKVEEPCIWADHGEPARVELAELRRSLGRVAAAALLGRYWREDTRHDSSLALAGGLLRAGWSVDDAAELVRVVCKVARDPETDDRVRAVRDTANAVKAGDPATGWPTLEKLLGEGGDKIVHAVRGWLGATGVGVFGDSGDGSGAPTRDELPWPGPPTPLGDDGDPPAFPLEMLPPVFGHYAAAVAEFAQVPPDMPALFGLAVAGAGLAGKFDFEIRTGWAQPPNLYVAGVHPVGERKTSVFNPLRAPVRDYEATLRDQMRPEIAKKAGEKAAMECRLKELQRRAGKEDDLAERAKLIDEVKELAREIAEFNVPAEPVFLVDDATVEAVAKTLVEQGGRLMQTAAEGTLFEIAGGRYSDDENFDVYLKGHERDPLRVARIGRQRLEHDAPTLTCAVLVQPDVLTGVGKSAKARGRGFLARWLYSVPTPRVGSRTVRNAPVAMHLTSAYRDVVLRIWSYPMPDDGPTVVPFTPEADDVLAGFEVWVEPQLGADGELAPLAGWGAKLAGAVARVSGIVHMVNEAAANRLHDPQPVPAEVVAAVAEFAKEYLIPHARRAFSVMATDPAERVARRLVRWLECHPDAKAFQRSEAFKAVKDKGDAAQAEVLTPAFALLCDHGYISQLMAPRGPGRPPERYAVILDPALRALTVAARGVGDAIASVTTLTQVFGTALEVVQTVIEPVARSLTEVLNAVGTAGTSVLTALRPLIEQASQLAATFGGVLAQAIVDLTPTLKQVAQNFAGIAEQLGPAIRELLPTLGELVGAFVKMQLGIGSALIEAITPLLPAVASLVELFGTLLKPLASVLGLVGPLVRVALLPLEAAFRVLGPVIETLAKVLDAVLQPVTAVIDEVTALAATIAEAFGDVIRDLMSSLPSLMPLLKGAVDFFADAMRFVAKVIHELADFVRDIFGLPERQRGGGANDSFNPNASQGLAVRNVSTGSIDDFIKKAQQAAFAGGGANADPAKQTATAATAISSKFDTLNRTVEEIRNLITAARETAGKAGGMVKDAAESGAFGVGGAILSRMITG